MASEMKHAGKKDGHNLPIMQPFYALCAKNSCCALLSGIIYVVYVRLHSKLNEVTTGVLGQARSKNDYHIYLTIR